MIYVCQVQRRETIETIVESLFLSNKYRTCYDALRLRQFQNLLYCWSFYGFTLKLNFIHYRKKTDEMFITKICNTYRACLILLSINFTEDTSVSLLHEYVNQSSCEMNNCLFLNEIIDKIAYNLPVNAHKILSIHMYVPNRNTYVNQLQLNSLIYCYVSDYVCTH